MFVVRQSRQLLSLLRAASHGKANLAFDFSKIKELIKEDQWDEYVLNNKKPVIIDFYADWCGPCKKLAPLLQQHLDASEDKFDILKINIDNHQELANNLSVSSIPAVFLVHNGEPLDQFQGMQEKKLEDFVNRAKKLADESK